MSKVLFFAWGLASLAFAVAYAVGGDWGEFFDSAAVGGAFVLLAWEKYDREHAEFRVTLYRDLWRAEKRKARGRREQV